jgi:hypothetical protein
LRQKQQQQQQQQKQHGKHRKCQWQHKSHTVRCPSVLIGHLWSHFVLKPRHTAPVVLFPPDSVTQPCTPTGKSSHRNTGYSVWNACVL